MNTLMQQTSLFAYHNFVKPNLSDRQKEVYEAIRLYPHDNFTDKEISRWMNWDINRITPRRGELLKMGLIRFSERRKCTITGSTANAWEKGKLID
jgi:hypothetical protein